MSCIGIENWKDQLKLHRKSESKEESIYLLCVEMFLKPKKTGGAANLIVHLASPV